MTTVTMYDSVTPGVIPTTAPAVAGYSDGKFNWTGSAWTRFLGSYRIPITVLGLHTGARVCDCETGDLTPMTAALWCSREIVSGRRPTVYCNRSTFPAVVQALKPRSLQFGRDVSLWLAWPQPAAPNLGALDVPYPGIVAVQYTQINNADLSVADLTWVRSVGNPPTGVPAGTGITDATEVTVRNNGQSFTTDIGTLRGLVLPPSTQVVVGTTPPFTSDVGTLVNAGVL